MSYHIRTRRFHNISIGQDIVPFMPLAALHDGLTAEGSLERFAQPFGSIDHTQQPVVSPQVR